MGSQLAGASYERFLQCLLDASHYRRGLKNDLNRKVNWLDRLPWHDFDFPWRQKNHHSASARRCPELAPLGQGSATEVTNG